MEKKNGVIENKIPDINRWVTTDVPNTKIGEVENKISDVSELATTAVFNTQTGKVEDKILDLSGLVKNTTYNVKHQTLGKKYMTTADYNQSTGEIIGAKIKQKNGQWL